MIAVLLTFFGRLPRPWRRRRPVVVPPAAPVAEHPAMPYGRRCALLNPFGQQAHRVVSRYQDDHVGVVDRGMVAFPEGMHRAPEPTVQVQFVGDDDYPTVPIVLPRDTAAWPMDLAALLAPLPVAAGAR